MDTNLEIARTKLTANHLAKNSTLSEAESLLRGLRETVTFLERRIAREKLAAAKQPPVVLSAQLTT